MDGGGTATEQDTFESRLIDIIAMEYGERHTNRMEGGFIIVHKDDRDIVIQSRGSYATVRCCIKDWNGDIVLIPAEKIADNIPNLVSSPHIQPSIELSADKRYFIPHYAAYIEESDLEEPRWIIRTMENISILASVATLFWHDPTPEDGDQRIEVDEMVYDDSESDDEYSEDEDFDYLS